MKRIISILLISLMVIAEAGIAVMAAGEPAAVSDLQAFSAFKGAVLEWTPADGATSYEVYRNGKLVKSGVTSKSFINTSKMYYYDRTNNETGTSYKYYVVAVNASGKSPASNVVSKNCVAPLYYNVTFKGRRTLKAHDGSGARHTFSKGQRVKAHSYKFGQYIFRYGGHTYHVNYYNATSYYAYTAKHYNKKSPRVYSDKEAEYFVNTTGVKSDTNWLVWASLYTQRLYVFYRTNGKWRLAKNLTSNSGVKGYKWGISSGKATSPSPASLYYEIYKKQRSKNGVSYWSYYFSQTSLHGPVNGQGLDRPRSEGCIRNPLKYAKTLYDKVPVGSRVIVY